MRQATNKSFAVTIVGGGPAGMMTCVLLARAGVLALGEPLMR